MKNFKLLTLFLIFTIATSPAMFVDGKAFAIDLEQQQIIFKNEIMIEQKDIVQKPKHNFVTLTESLSIQTDDQKKDSKLQNVQHNFVVLHEDVSMSIGSIDNAVIVMIKGNDERRTIMERIFDRTKLNRIIFDSAIHSVEDDLTLDSLADKPQSETSYNDLELGIDQRLPTMLIDFSVSEKQFDELYQSVYATTDQLVVTTTSLFNVNNPIFMLVVPLAGFILIRIENDKLDFNSLKRLFCFVFVTILISSAVITPLSISSAYWDVAYAEEVNDAIQVTQVSELDSSSTTETETEPVETPEVEQVETPETASETESEPVDSFEATILENFQNLGGSSTIEPVESVNATAIEPVESNATAIEPVESVNATTIEPVESVNATAIEQVESVNATAIEQVESVNATTIEPVESVNATTIEPVESNATAIEPVESNATTIEPVESVNATTIEPVESNATTIEPVDSNTTSVEPVNATTIEPVESNATAIEPVDSNTTSVEPVNATAIEPVESNATTIEPVESNATSVEPEIIIPEATVSFQFDEPESVSSENVTTTEESSDGILELDGDGGFIQIENVTVTNDLDGLTVTAWVKPDYSAGSSEFTILSKEKSFSLTINNNIQPAKVAKFAVFDGIKWTTVESTSIIEEKWTFLSSTFSGESIAIFVNGTKENTKEIIGLPALSVSGKLETTTVENISSEEDIVVGASITTKNQNSTPSNQFSGEIDDVLLYDYVLEDEQILAMYEQTKDSYIALEVPELSIEEIVAQIAAELAENNTTTELVDNAITIEPVESNATSVEPVNATTIEPVDSNATTIEPVESVNATTIEPVDAITTEPIDITIMELTITPTLTTMKETYLITEDAELELEFYDEYDVLMQELEELEIAMALLEAEIELTLNEMESDLIVPTATEEATTTEDILYFIGKLFIIQKADAAQIDGDDQIKIEIAKAKEEIQKLKDKINAIKNDGTLDEEELKDAKAQLKAVIDQIKATAEKTKTKLKTTGDDLQKSANKIEKAGDVEAEISVQKGKWVGIDETVETVIYGPDDEEISIDYVHEKLRDGKFAIKLTLDRDSKPGLYKIVTTLTKNGETFVVESEFAWGVLAINIDKSIYLPNEDAFIAMAVLDEEGETVCNADVTLTITSPSGAREILSTANGRITISEECKVLGVTNLPDYYTEYTVNGIGVYTMDLTAVTNNGARSIQDSFVVQSSVEFDVTRDGPTRIYPLVPYTMDFTINVNADYNGKIIEYVPASFEITPQNGLTVQTSGDAKTLSWNVNMKKGETISLSYEFDAPDVSPAFYLLGPLEIGAFAETRQWQIASDAVAFVVTGTTGAQSTGSPVTFTIDTSSAGSFDILVLGVMIDTTSVTTSGAPTYGAAGCSSGTTSQNFVNTGMPIATNAASRVETWFLTGLIETGSACQISVDLTGAPTNWVAGAYLLSDADQSTPIGVTATGASTSLNVGTTTGTNGLVVIFGANQNNGVITINGGTADRVDSFGLVGGANKFGADGILDTTTGSSQTVTWTLSKETIYLTAGFEILIQTTDAFNRPATESVGVTDDVVRVATLSTSLTESLSTADDVAGVATQSASLPESVGVIDDVAGVATLSASLPESVGVTDDVAGVATQSTSLTESLSTADDVAGVATLSASLPESVGVTDDVARGVAQSASLTESVGVIDDVARVATLSASLPESLSTADDVTRAATLSASLPESLSTADDVARVATISASLPESVGVIDDVARVATISASLPESVGVIDDVARLATLSASLPESVGVIDDVAGGATQSASLLESVGVIDDVARVATLSTSLTESVGVTDDVARLATISASLTESVGVIDDVARLATISASLTESVGVIDDVARGFAVTIPLTESVGVTDDVARVATISASLTEPVGVIDDVARVATLSTSLTESLSTADDVAGVATLSASLTESLSTADDVVRVATLSASLPESVGVTDDVVRVATLDISLTESLSTADDVARVATLDISLTESLSTADDVARVATFGIILAESVGVTDDVSRVATLSASLTESLSTADDVARVATLSASLTESLSTADDVARGFAVSIPLTESVGVTDDVARVATLSASLTESLSTADDVARVATISASLTESLSTADDVARVATFGIILAESVGVTDDVSRVVTLSASLPESLSTADDIARIATLGIILAESVGITDDVTRVATLSASLTESLSTADDVARGSAVAIPLTESVGVTDDVARVATLSASLPESVGITDDVARVATLSASLPESVGITDDVAGAATLSASLPESVGITDDVARVTTLGIPLTESVGVTDDVARAATLSASLPESLSTADDVARAATLSALLPESVGVTDDIKKVVLGEFTRTVTESITITDFITKAVNLAPNQVLVSNINTQVTAEESNTQFVIVSSDAALTNVIITSGVTDISIDYSEIQSGSDVTIENGFTIDADIEDDATFDVQVQFADDTTMTGPTDWDGVLTLPEFTTVSLDFTTTSVAPNGDTTTTTTFSEVTAFEIGVSDEEITFDEPVRIEFSGDGGSQGFEVFFSRGGSTTFITTECTADNLNTVKSQLGGTGECKFDNGTDLIVWTTHFTAFGDGKRSTSVSTTIKPTGSSGGTGTGPGGAGTSGFGVILFSPLQILEISYDVCTENMVAILVANDDAVIPTVTLQTTKSGTIKAVLATEQPFEEKNKFTTVDKYLFVAPLDPKETFIMVQVKAAAGAKVNSVSSAIHLTECQGIILFGEQPEEFEGIDFMVPRIFDVKIQIDNGTLQSAISPEVTYLDEQELTVSAIVNSQVPLKRAELRYVIVGQSEDDYIAFLMDINPLEGIATASKISASIPPVFMVAPGIEYWIYVMDENLDEVTSQHYTMGVKPAYDVDASLELDIPTSKPEGSTIRPSAYVINHAEEPAFGTVSLLVDGKVVSSTTEFFGAGETKVPLEWVIPKERKHMVYVVQAKLDLYDTSATTEKAYVSSFMKTRIISISEMQTIQPLTDQAGNTVAQPALLYASDSVHDNLRFRVIGNGGFCFIGATDECAVKESTLGNRGGIESIEHNGIIYRVKYSGADSPLERFSITSVDQISPDWNITLESMDDFIPQAYAMEDIHLKVKYRTISDLVTVSSE